MKVIYLCAVLLFAINVHAQSAVFEIVVMFPGEKISVAADTRNSQCAANDPNPHCSYSIYDFPRDHWATHFPEWPIEHLKRGDVLKARWAVDGRLEPVAGSCMERKQQAQERWCKENGVGYDCGRLGANTFIPADCSRPRSTFINNMLYQFKDDQ